MLKINNIKKAYKGKSVLNGVDLHLKKGEIKAIIGVNGAGKSTLVDIVCGVKKMDSGTIDFCGENCQDRCSKTDIKKLLGYVPQSFSLFDDLTVRENLEYVGSVYGVSKVKIEEVESLCYLEEYSKVLAKNLSGGYKQLLMVASAIMHQPKLLILDEPTSAMDPIFRKNFWKVIKSINKQGVSILLITHYIEELLECDTFAILQKGVISYDGKTKEFKEKGFINIGEILNKFQKTT